MSNGNCPKEQLAFDLRAAPSMQEEDFFVSSCNEIAFQMVQSWPQWPFYAISIYGPSECGKTHLRRIWQGRSQGSLLHPNVFQTDNIFLLAKSKQAIALDGLSESVENSEFLQQQFFHLLNIAKEEAQSLLILDEKPLARWDIKLLDLKSRLSAIPAFEMKAPDDQILSMLLSKLFHDRQLRVSNEVVHYLCCRTGRSFRDINQVVEQVDRLALSRRKQVSIQLIKDVLEQKS